MTALLTATGLTKTFPGVRALDRANLTIASGRVHALLGENGAGKSTLIKILTGVYRPDAGRILVDGREAHLHSPERARRAGIGVVHQERNLIGAFSVAENICLEQLPHRRGLVDRGRITAEARRCLGLLDLDLDPATPVSRLSPAQAQLVEIAKALAAYSKVLLLDEPTASLTSDEADRLYSVVRRLRDAGHGIVLVTHKLEEVFAVADQLTVLRDGRSVVESSLLGAYSHDDVVNEMVGREHSQAALTTRRVIPPGTPALAVTDVSTAAGHRDITLQVRPGEILGLYGLVGAGRTELAKTLLGLGRITRGSVVVDGATADIRDVGDALRRHRIGYVTENRKEEGLFLEQTIARNVAVTVWSKLARFGLVRDRAERAILTEYTRRLNIRLSSAEQLAGQLSGGNQQKVSLAKWLAADCRVLIIDEPTVGIDVRSKGAFHQLIGDLADSGVAVLLISSDLPEVVALANRIAVMRDYRIAGEVVNTREYTPMSRAIIRLIHGTGTA
ncbi:sugar ABC transporter ATP-binding protein [Longispora sp. K20-0274]|uniref:sugar ABC transporter ATP-binding protein n=1 Tax=Longispora sp. K20-0274 TaxID=3088255 RepID=UPI003999E12D